MGVGSYSGKPGVVPPNSDTSQTQAGVTLVEMMVALVILGVILAAAASSLISLTRASAVNEHRVQATAYLTALHEEVQGLPWDRAALYEDEVEDNQTALEAAFGVSLADMTYQGEDLATLPGPVNTECPTSDPDCGRLPFVPTPYDEITIDGRDFELFQLITERSTIAPDDENDIRRFITIVRWRLLGRDYEEVFESQRAPSPAERRQAEDPDLRLLLVSPRVVELRPDGTNASDITVLARYRAGTTGSLVRFPTESTETDETMDPDLELGDPLIERGAWEVTIPAGDLQFGCDEVLARDEDGNVIEDDDGNPIFEEPPSCLKTVEVLGTGPSDLTIEGARNITVIPHKFVVDGRDPPAIIPAVVGPPPRIEPTVAEVDLGLVGSDENALCDPLTVDVTAEADELDIADAKAADSASDGLEVRVFFTARDSTSRGVPLVGSLTAPDSDGRQRGQFQLTFPEEQTAPWSLNAGETYKDRFYAIASSGDGEGRFSTYVASGVLTIQKAQNGSCPGTDDAEDDAP